jgi:copper chaperone NosL
MIKKICITAQLILLLIVFLSCKPQGPQDFKVGEFQCDHCQMGIVDLRFRAEIISRKGRIYRFDAVECLFDWSQKKKELIGTSWVADFFNPKNWIDYNKAFYLKSENLPSPMGAYVSSYARPNDRELSIKEHGGITMDKEALEAYLSKRNISSMDNKAPEHKNDKSTQKNK